MSTPSPSRFETVMGRVLGPPALSKPNALPEGWTATRDLHEDGQVSVRPLIVEGEALLGLRGAGGAPAAPPSRYAAVVH